MLNSAMVTDTDRSWEEMVSMLLGTVIKYLKFFSFSLQRFRDSCFFLQDELGFPVTTGGKRTPRVEFPSLGTLNPNKLILCSGML